MAVETPQKAATQKIAHAMTCIAEIAKLYKKHGSPANYRLATKTKKGNDYPQFTRFTRSWKRNIRKLAQHNSPFKRGPLARCGTCQLYFVAPAAARCQCPPAKSQRSEA